MMLRTKAVAPARIGSALDLPSSCHHDRGERARRRSSRREQHLPQSERDLRSASTSFFLSLLFHRCGRRRGFWLLRRQHALRALAVDRASYFPSSGLTELTIARLDFKRLPGASLEWGGAISVRAGPRWARHPRRVSRPAPRPPSSSVIALSTSRSGLMRNVSAGAGSRAYHASETLSCWTRLPSWPRSFAGMSIGFCVR